MLDIKSDVKQQLSAKELAVVRHLIQGKANKQIARELFIEECTVKFHCSNIYKKLNVANRVMLITKVV